MSDFIREVDEEVRQDQFKRLIDRYWFVLAGLVVLILAGVGAWKAYEYLSAEKAQAAGGQYLQALDLARDGKSTEAAAALRQVVADGTPGYRMLARFRLAAEIGAKDKPAGAKMFDELAADPSVDPAFQTVARLRAALLLVDSLSYADLQQRVGPLADANSILRNSARELLAIAALKADKTADAGRYLDAIETDPTTSAAMRQRVEAMSGLVRSAGTPPAPAPTAPAAPAVSPPADSPPK